MTTRVTLHSDPDGQMVVQKVALTDDLTASKAEAQWLVSARDPGVVQLVSVTEDPFTITTAHAGATTLRTDHLTADRAATLLASVCDTLGRLHERSIFHGKLTLDHIIITSEGSAVLCSPDGQAGDPTQDLESLGRMTSELISGWRAEKGEIPNEAEWLSLADRLASDTPALTARRATRAFARLGSEQLRPVATTPRRRRFAHSFGRLAAVLGVLVIFAIAVQVLRTTLQPQQAEGGTEISIGTDLYRVGRAGDVVIAVPKPCQGQPKAVLLDRDSVIWVFDSAVDGATGQPLVQVPGATNLSITSSDGCSQVWASGPAGQTLVVDP